MEPTGRARVNPNDPASFGMCDRCGFWFSHKDLVWNYEWSGTHLYNQRILVCTKSAGGPGCADVPQEQLRTIVLPSDPLPILNARVPNFAYEEQTPIIMQFAGPKLPPWGAGPELIMCDETGEQAFVLQYLTSS